MIDRVYAIHTDEECERLDAQALLGGVSDHLRHVPAQPGMRILDAGCGSGSMAREIARAAPETITVGIDLRDKYIDHARMRATAEGLQNLTFQTGDVRELPFPEGTFDIVWTKYLLQWVAEPMLAMREFARVLKPGGLLVSANFDGFAVTHEPPDPAIQPMTEFVFSNLVDPFIGWNEDFRFYSLLAVKHRLRPLVRPSEQSPAIGRSGWLSTLRYRSHRSGHLSDRRRHRRVYPGRGCCHHPTESPDGGRTESE